MNSFLNGECVLEFTDSVLRIRQARAVVHWSDMLVSHGLDRDGEISFTVGHLTVSHYACTHRP